MLEKIGVDVVITTYNGEKHIPNTLKSLEKQSFRNFNCFVIDDHSTDDTVIFIRRDFPWAKIIQQPRNYGPAFNRNVASRAGDNRYIIFLDDDIFLDDQDWIKKGVVYLESHPHVGQIASMILSGFDKDIILDCGIKNLGLFFGGVFHKKHKNSVFNRHKISGEVLGACSAATIVRRDAFELVGGFDKKYYYMGEDLDLSIKLHLAGYSVIYFPDLITYHLESQAMGKRLKRKYYLYIRNSIFILLKYYPFCSTLKRFLCLSNYKSIVDKEKSSLGHNNVNQRNFVLRLKHLFQKVHIFFDREHVRTINDFKYKIIAALLGFCSAILNLPMIICKRFSVNNFRKKPRRYLLDIDNAMKLRLSLVLPVKSLIFQITNKCNASCNMCFMRSEINKDVPLLSLEEIRLFIPTLRNLENIVLGGGEPFVRNDVEEICRFLLKTNPNICITIPTNGFDPSRIYEKTKQILALGCRELIISLSLDGLQEYHDQNRGIKGLFKRVCQTYDELEKLFNFYPKQLRLQVNTCVTKKNISQLEGLSDFIYRQMKVAKWSIEPVRGISDLSYKDCLSLKEWYSLKKNLNRLFDKHSFSQKKILNTLFEYSIRVMEKKSQPVSCCAGDEFIVIDYCGNVSPCEIFPDLKINIRKFDYDIDKVLAQQEWRETLSDIKRNKCYCTHFCWLSYSLANAGIL